MVVSHSGIDNGINVCIYIGIYIGICIYIFIDNDKVIIGINVRRGGSEFFTFFPNSNNRNMTLTFMIYGTDIGEIYGTFGTYMAYI